MSRFPTIRHMLRTAFNVEDGLSEDVAIRFYQRSATRGDLEKLKQELQLAFAAPDFSWREMLSNQEYEVFDVDSEDEAREYARRILWKPIFYNER
ncbi:hypothetical protein [Steroidobacter flavus]